MTRMWVLALMGAPLWAACPTSTDANGRSWPGTCFVSTRGDDTTGTGTWAAPFLTIGKAYLAMGKGTGDSMVIRAGRYAGDVNTIYQPVTAKCTAEWPCTIRSYPGEVVIIDGSAMSYRAWYMSKFGSVYDTPIYSSDPRDGHWRFAGLRFENVPAGPVWNQGMSDDMVLKSVWSRGSAGLAFSTCGSCRIFGSHIEVDGPSPQKGLEGTPFGCSGMFPTYYQSPWSSGSSTGYATDYWQIVNETPQVAQAVYPSGCNDLIVQDSDFVKRHSTAVDTFAFETANGVMLERFHSRSPDYQGADVLWTLWGSQGGTDGIDIKGRNIVINDSSSIGGKGALKVWGSAKVQNTLVIGGEDTGEAALSGMQRYYQGASNAEWPNLVEYRTVRDVFNDPFNGDSIVVMSKIVGGMGAIEGTEVIISDVPGCTGLNGHKVIKHIYHGNGYPVMFSVQNVDGSAFTCPDAYNVGAHQFKVMPGDSSWFSSVTFTSGSQDVTVPGLTSTYLVYAGDRIRFSTTGTLPAGLTAGVDYYLTYRSGTTARLAATRGGAAVTFSGAGSGVHSAQVVDERTSYAGRVMIAPYTQEFRNMTILSKYRYAVDLCGGCDDRAGSSIGWGFHDTVVSSPNLGAVRQAYFLVAKPRAFFTNGAADVVLEYFDASALAVGRVVYFEGTCLLPSPLQPRTAYYVVASNAEASTIQVSETPGGTAISNYVNNTGCAYARQFLTASGFASSVVSVSADVFHSGDTVTVGGYGTPPYPAVTGASYYVDTESTVTAGGVSFRHLTLKQNAGDATPLRFAAPPERLDNWLRSVTTAGAAMRNFEVSAFTTLDQSDRNLYYSAVPAKAYCGLNQAHGGNDTQGTCAVNQAALNTQEPASAIADPALNDNAAGRATASSPPALWNKGYLARTAEVEAGPGAAVLRFRAPAAADACSVNLYADAAWSTLLESHASRSGGRSRALMLGIVTPLQPAHSYWYRVQCGYDVTTGWFQTSATQSGTARLGLHLAALPGTSQAVLETSIDGANWVAGAAVSCGSGCDLQSADVARGAALWYRWRRLDAGGATLERGAAVAAVAR